MLLILRKVRAISMIVLFITVCFVALDGGAADTNRKESEIIVKAKEIRLNKHEGAAFFEGDVELLDGNYNISAQRARIIFKDDRPSNVLVNGSPATLDLEEKKERKGIHCEGDIIQYEIGSDVIYLIGKSLVKSAKNEYYGAPNSCIAFTTTTRTVSACMAHPRFYYP